LDESRSPRVTTPRGIFEGRRAVTEDLAEFRAVYEAHFRFVWGTLRRLGVREADALDLTQKVFLTLHARAGDFEGRSKLRTFIFGICQRVASDYRRSAMVRYEVVTDSAELDARRESDEDAQVDAESRQHAAAAESILNKLPEPQRVVFVLFELDEMSGDEIAELLDVPVGTVRSRLRLAREAVRREVRRLAAADASKSKAAV
jgi:RNA polymerase sigma-70 factor (ECF subfamily)